MHFSNLNKTNLIFTILFFFFIIQCFSIEAHAGTKTIRLSYNKNDIKFSKQSDFDIISLPEFGFIQDSLKVGEPMMPVKTIRVLLPSGTEVTNVKIISTKEKQLEGKYYIYPIQYPVINGEQPERKFVEPKKEIYTSNENYPGILAEFQSENYFREYYIAEILVYPLQYKPSKRELTLYTEISFEIEYIASAKYQLIPRLRQNEKK
ncbi:MAG: hypothetical protein COT43_07450 [Candidatus Marinimicrobia bacterium CG08_land_8_20_14_0_20_45_22]|nr:MAG: hypothetical protein COT43_07450 [Candidatus Marinimicrobia bacterium CG08_land_8_20_14_0_20_45_22]